MRHKPIKLFLPEDLATYVEGVDGRKIPAMIFAALRAQWGPKVTMIHLGSYVAVTNTGEPSHPVYGSIPADRKTNG